MSSSPYIIDFDKYITGIDMAEIKTEEKIVTALDKMSPEDAQELLTSIDVALEAIEDVRKRIRQVCYSAQPLLASTDYIKRQVNNIAKDWHVEQRLFGVAMTGLGIFSLEAAKESPLRLKLEEIANSITADRDDEDDG